MEGEVSQRSWVGGVFGPLLFQGLSGASLLLVFKGM